ncbi:MAG: hypothetical protein FWC78_06285 [Defluviitaleaceae bacterium]|nr:hypothetical protein [Defluviitaleaceae bacterium]
MLLPLVKYNINYYIKSAKYLPPVIIFVAFIGIMYQTRPIGIWSNLHVTAVALFIFASWIAATFVNSEDKTQQYITMLHVKNETKYHLAKIISIMMFLIPFFVFIFLLPAAGGFFARNLLASEVIVYLAVYFLVCLMGVGMGIFFNSHILPGEMGVLVHFVAIIVAVLPFNVIFADIPLVVFANHLLPPINFLADRLHNLGEDIFVIDLMFWGFVAWTLGYALLLMVGYCALVQWRNKLQ